MSEEKKLTYRTYEIVLRQLNGINKGVQAEHSCKRYMWKYRNDAETALLFDPECPDNETTIMVDGGTHQEMVEIQRQLEEAGIKHAYFNEPDLNDCLTAITVIADERVWDRRYFQRFEDFENYFETYIESEIQTDLDGVELIGKPDYNEWLIHIGGEKNAKLIEILNGKRLSQV